MMQDFQPNQRVKVATQPDITRSYRQLNAL